MIAKTKQLILLTLQTAVNHYLALDPESLQRVAALKNKIVKIELLGIDITFYLKFTEQDVQFEMPNAALAPTPDTIIKGTPIRLLHMTLANDKRRQFFEDDVSIQGDLTLGQAVTHLFDQVDIDWEEQLSRLVGDASAHHLGTIFRKVSSWGKETRETLLQDVNEYVHEEIQLIPAKEALHDFFHEVDVLRMDVDRLEAKLHQLQKAVLAKRGQR